MNQLILASILFILFSCSPSDDAFNHKQVLVPQKPELLATGYQFTEGPAWSTQGYLLFSDISGNAIYKWHPINGLTRFVNDSENSNGIAFNGTEAIVCRHRARDVARLNQEGEFTPIVAKFGDKKLNSPNDLEVGLTGQVYFTDPAYGIQPEEQELDFEGLYFVPAGGDKAELIDDELVKPNGITFNGNKTELYVCESSTNTIYRYPLGSDGIPTGKNLFYQFSEYGEIDGITCDNDGYLYVAFGNNGIYMLTPKAEPAGKILFPLKEKVRNLCFADTDEKQLFVTAGASLYRVSFVNESDE